MKSDCTVFLAGLLSLLVYATATGAATVPAKVVIAYSTLNERGAGALLVAQDQGIFRKHELDAQSIYVRSGALALSALSSGDAQFYFGSANGSTLGAMAGGLDAVFVSGLVNKLNGTFVVAPSVRSPSDLKNKNVGIQSVGGGIWMITLLVLDHWGLDPKRDGINLRIMGDESVLAQSLVTGIIDATYAGYTYASLLKRQGFRVLADLTKLDIPYQSTGVLARRSFINSSPETTEKLLRSMVEAIAFIQNPANKGAVMKSLAKGLHLARVEEAEEGYGIMKTLYERRIYPNAEGIGNAIRLLGIGNDKIRSLKPENIMDERIVRKLEKEGLF